DPWVSKPPEVSQPPTVRPTPVAIPQMTTPTMRPESPDAVPVEIRPIAPYRRIKKNYGSLQLIAMQSSETIKTTDSKDAAPAARASADEGEYQKAKVVCARVASGDQSECQDAISPSLPPAQAVVPVARPSEAHDFFDENSQLVAIVAA